MNTKTALSGLLAIQLIIIAGLWWYAQNQSNSNLPQALLGYPLGECRQGHDYL